MDDFKLIKKLFKIENRNGFSSNDIKIAKEKFGNLPKVLTDYYSELGKFDELNFKNDILVSLKDLQLTDNNYVPIYYESKSMHVWAIKKSDLNMDNPAIYFSVDRINWYFEFTKLSDFFISMAHKQAIFGLKYNTGEFYEITEKEFNLVKMNIRRKNIYIPKRWAIEFFSDYDDALIAVTKGFEGLYLITYSSSSEDHFYKISDFLFEI